MMTMEFTEPDLAYLVARAHSTARAMPMAAEPHVRFGVADAPRSATTIWSAPPAHRAVPDEATVCTGTCTIPEAQPLPSWAMVLNAVVGTAGQVAWDWLDTDLVCPLDPAAPLPFEEVLLPFIYAGRQALRAQVAGCYALLDTASHQAMERRLLIRLSRLCHPALEVAYAAFRSEYKQALAWMLPPVADPDKADKALYYSFVMNMLWSDLLTFFTREPVLAQQAAVITEGWVNIVAALLETLPPHAQPGCRLPSTRI